MELVCKICNTQFPKLGSLHRHLSSKHFLTQKDYYRSYFPREDLYSGEPIDFKAAESYFGTDFNSKENFCLWLLKNKKTDKAKDYFLSYIKNRCDKKGIKHFPSQVDLKSLFSPSWKSIPDIFGGVELALDSIQLCGLMFRYDYLFDEAFDVDTNIPIIQDTREQTPLPINTLKSIMKLPCGDYAPYGDFYKDIVIERKSQQDLIGTLVSGKERFCRELDKARELGLYVVILVESSYNSVRDYEPSNGFTKKVNGSHIMHEIRDINITHGDVCQFLFGGNRYSCVDLVYKVFSLGERVRSVDLEFLKDKGII